MLKKIGRELPKQWLHKCLNAVASRQFNELDEYTGRTKRSVDYRPQWDTGMGRDDFSVQKLEKFLQFSKEQTMNNFGELPQGEIPECLKYDREWRISTLSNGLRVATESWPSPVSAVGVFIKAGSRNETLDTSGTAHFMEHLHFKGTERRTRTQLETECENVGLHLNAYTSREMTVYHVQSFKENTGKAVDILGDMLLHSLYNPNQIEAERDTILQELLDVNNDFVEVTMENVYYNIYRDHMMGQPILGDRNNIRAVSQDMIKEFHAANYIAPNMVVVGTGGVNHEEFCQMVESQFGHAASSPPSGLEAKGRETPIYTPGVMMIRDDEMPNSNVGIFFEAPTWTHEDYYPFLLIERIFGQYMAEKHAEHLFDVKKQYNALHSFLAEMPDVTKHQAIYSPYEDTAIFGNYFFGNEVFTRSMNYIGLALPCLYSDYLNEAEVYRARNRLYNELCQLESTADVMQSIGQQLLNLNRRVPRSEIAKRVALIDPHHLRNVFKGWFYDKEPSITNWGPLGSVADIGSYSEFKINTTTSVTNIHHSLRDWKLHPHPQ